MCKNSISNWPKTIILTALKSSLALNRETLPLIRQDTNPKPVQNAGTIVLLNNYGTKGSFLSLFLLKLEVFC